ncbi:MAG: chemotaxis protein CheA, partial [Porticoccaceae bacterium]
ANSAKPDKANRREKPEPAEQPQAKNAPEPVDLVGKKAAPGSQNQPVNQAGSSTQVKEVVRIGSETLDTLVNLSGENIIFRGRVEEQVSEFNHSLDEMDATILRLQEQVRRLGTETEAQIDYRREQIEASGEAENFDPLEMDRYSHLQQLSGSLAESASDLSDLKETLADKMVDTESLLIHQSRINVDLQEGLMQTRMVPFSRILPRLRRIVSQVSLELGKEVQLSLDNVQGEMDRTVLDRMVAPLEHMIRNGIDHGIETEKQRKAAGKPTIGTIAITTYRKGGDIILHLADDGAGLDIPRIKSLAIDKQLMHKNALLSDHEIAQFIFHPGFTTLDSVSEISGRGVGMDVVSSEVRQLGGSVDIDSSPGQGTQFTIVLPFTLAVNRALMINVTGDNYALSLNSIDGVYFVSPEKLAAAIDSDGKISYGGKQFRRGHRLCCFTRQEIMTRRFLIDLINSLLIEDPIDTSP